MRFSHHYVYAPLESVADGTGHVSKVQDLDVLVDDQRTARARRELKLWVDTFRDTLNEYVFRSRFHGKPLLTGLQSAKRVPSCGSCVKTGNRCTTAVLTRRATVQTSEREGSYSRRRESGVRIIALVHPRDISLTRSRFLSFREDALMTATNNATETLQRTMGLMQKELERRVLFTR